MLKKIRQCTATVVIVLATLLFLDFTGSIHLWFGWLAKVQLIPAILAVNAAVVVILVLLTLVLGRIYCSVICPLGILQDVISHAAGQRKGHKNRFRYSKAITWLRYGILVLFIIAMVAGISAVASLLDPYAAYGRIASNLLAPVYRLGNNVLAWIAETAGSYAFYDTEVWVKSWIVMGAAALTLGVVATLAWRGGRTYCNTVCPVGSLLGLLSKYSLFRPEIDTRKCTKCGLCEKNCKSSCIDAKAMSIDRSRCVVCFECMDKCKFGAMNYTARKLKKEEQQDAGKNAANRENAAAPEADIQTKRNALIGGASQAAAGERNRNVEHSSQPTQGISRRGFISLAGMIAVSGTIKAQQVKVDGGLADIENKKVPQRKTPIVPPGAGSMSHIKQHCTACQLCVSSCPNNVLRPSSHLETLMQPEMSFERGYCRPECTECSQVCPAGAIKPITTAEKSAIAIGHAVWIRSNCVALRDDVPCTACESHCPTGAITLIRRRNDSQKTPVVDKEMCIGCGACEHLCPARPFSAIYVEGYDRHHPI